MKLSAQDIQVELDRRRPGQSHLTTSRQETDEVQILSGLFEGKTLGTPIGMVVYNKDARPKDYKNLKDAYRPSHADYTYDAKFGIRNWQGGGRASARETWSRVAAGAIAQKLLKIRYGVQIVAYVTQVQDVEAEINPDTVTRSGVDKSLVRCPAAKVSKVMVERVEAARTAGDSLGGVIECVARKVPPGWGSPVFDKLEADLAKAMLSIPATKGFEIGSGFAGTRMTGSEHNDPFYMEKGRVRTRTNYSGGIQGGISNGENILLRVAFKPTSTIRKKQHTVTPKGKEVMIEAKGRHDPCVLPRAVPVVEAMAALVLADHALRHAAQCG